MDASGIFTHCHCEPLSSFSCFVNGVAQKGFRESFFNFSPYLLFCSSEISFHCCWFAIDGIFLGPYNSCSCLCLYSFLGTLTLKAGFFSMKSLGLIFFSICYVWTCFFCKMCTCWFHRIFIFFFPLIAFVSVASGWGSFSVLPFHLYTSL